MDCLFCKIVRGEIPSLTIYEDEKVKAFLDINPHSNGHTLIIPKNHYTNLSDIDEDTLAYINNVAKKLYPTLKEKLNCDGLSLCQNNDFGQEVKHYHLHLIPRYKDDNWHTLYNKDLVEDPKDIYEILKK